MPANVSKIVGEIRAAMGPVFVAGLHGGAKAFVLAHIVRHFPQDTVVVVTATEERACQFMDDCRVFFHPDDAQKIKIFPELSTLPFSHVSPEPETQGQRIDVLHEIIHSKPGVIISPVAAIMRRLPPMKFISDASRVIRLGERCDPFELAGYLTQYGYEDVGLVEDEGTFARRGGIVDVWSPTTELPVRMELDGDKIASLRFFDPATQRSKGDVPEFVLIPVRDFPFDEATRNRVSHAIRGRQEGARLSASARRALTSALREGIAFSGIETFMPLFHESTSTLFDYLATNTTIINDDGVEVDANARAHYSEVVGLAKETESPEKIITPDEIVLEPSLLTGEMSRFRLMYWDALSSETSLTTATYGNSDISSIITGHKAGEDLLGPLVDRMQRWQEEGMHIVLTCHTELQAQRIKDLFRYHGLEPVPFDGSLETLFEMSTPQLRLKIGRLSAGFKWPDERLVVITDGEIFGSKVLKRQAPLRPMEPFTSFAEVSDGDFIVHERHGIGRYRGLVHLTIDEKPGDYLLIEYLGGDKLYLPVYRLNLVGRYIGSGDTPPFLDRLGSTRWSQVQKKTDAAIRVMARELLDIYATRKIYPGFSFPLDEVVYEEFSAEFPYDETPDQTRAIDDVMRDMITRRPMDRLICGDVGYGKTEVAMRAAFRAAMAGKQAAILVPTTVLALQHYETFVRRFSKTPVVVEMLTRLKSHDEQKKIVERISGGGIDIVIGTHRLLQKGVRFRDLGLLIIDEEHRFGVRHKEKIKKMKTAVDVLALTATPIPRTLNLSLAGIRDISVMNTPPADRHSIATYVIPFDEGVIRGAILKEIGRGGQVFFVHNRVETIASMHERLKRLVPEAEIVVGHGQLKEGELERVMIEFLEGRARVLLCTAIIESGLDIPTANTIIINRADTFGLAELYQLRGRVGRSSVHANAYLLIPQDGEITTGAKKRLTVIRRFTELGSGFQIAMHDLEFRGAGNILGSDQSGHIAAIGYEMYTRLLERAVRRIEGRGPEEEIDPELNLRVAAFLPQDYISDPGTRIDIYKRLANRESEEEIIAIGDELRDRFGALPEEAVNLMGVMEIKLMARILKIKQIVFDGSGFSIQLDSTTPLAPDKIVMLSGGEAFRLVPPDRLLIKAGDVADDENVLGSAKNSLRRLMACVSN